MPQVRLVRGRHNSRDAKGHHIVYEKGEEFSVTDSQYKAFKDKFELVDGETDPEDVKFNVKKASREELLAKAEELGLEVDPSDKLKDLRAVIGEALEEGGED